MKVTREHCGLPFAAVRATLGRALYCCSGCALAARVPVDANGQFPVNVALLTALSLGFGLFNQLLFWLLAVLVARQSGGMENAARLAWVSFGIGAVVWAALVLCQARVGARRGADWVLAGIVCAGLAEAWLVASPGLAFAANAVLAIWALRGLRRRKG